MPQIKPSFKFKNKCLLCQKPCHNKYCDSVCREIAFLKRRLEVLDIYRYRLKLLYKKKSI